MSDNIIPRILIVEDDQAFREAVCDFLRDEGYRVKGARSLKKAAKRLNKHDFNLVLSDINLGNHTGFDVLQVAMQTRPYAKIVMMSAQAEAEIMEQALASGVTRYLPKPFRASDLLAIVEELLQRTPNQPPINESLENPTESTDQEADK